MPISSVPIKKDFVESRLTKENEPINRLKEETQGLNLRLNEAAWVTVTANVKPFHKLLRNRLTYFCEAREATANCLTEAL